jgi:hypothetical protein
MYFDYLFQSTGLMKPSINTDLDWTVFPNPATDVLMVENQRISKPSGYQKFLLTDGAGKLLLSERLANFSNRINVDKFPDGLYFYKIEGNTHSQTGKILIQHK